MEKPTRSRHIAFVSHLSSRSSSSSKTLPDLWPLRCTIRSPLSLHLQLRRLKEQVGQIDNKLHSQTSVQWPPLGLQNSGCCWQVVVVQRYIYALKAKNGDRCWQLVAIRSRWSLSQVWLYFKWDDKDSVNFRCNPYVIILTLYSRYYFLRNISLSDFTWNHSHNSNHSPFNCFISVVKCTHALICIKIHFRAWFLIFTLSVAINCSITIFFACYCISMEGWKLLYVIGLIEALIFCGLGWLLSGFTVFDFCVYYTL